MLIFCVQVAFDNTQLVRVISSRSRSNIKVTFLKKNGRFGGISVLQTHLVCVYLVILALISIEIWRLSLWLLLLQSVYNAAPRMVYRLTLSPKCRKKKSQEKVMKKSHSFWYEKKSQENKSQFKINGFMFSSPEHKVLTVSYCDGAVSVVHHPLCVVNFLACLRSRGHIFSQIIMKCGQNFCLEEISDEFENGSCWAKTRSLGQISETLCVRFRGQIFSPIIL